MKKKPSIKDIISKIKKVHGDKYDYSLVDYKDSKTKIKIICPKHGVWEATFGNIYYRKSGCPECNIRTKPLTKTLFIKKAKEVHGDKYDYSLMDYKNNYTKIKIICPKHGAFEQNPTSHLQGCGCPKCAIEDTTISEEKFLLAVKNNNQYFTTWKDYCERKRIGTIEKFRAICKMCGSEQMISYAHLKSKKQPKCCRQLKAKEQYLKKAKIIHGDKYDYSLVDYKNNKTKVKIICPEHGVFEQSLINHIDNKCGCPICKESKGEKVIRIWLNKNNIEFESQKSFDDCKYKKPLKYDFYIPSKNLLIEYNGEQHYEAVNYFGGKKQFEINKKRDEAKSDYANKHKISLLVIPYWKYNNIEDILLEYFA